MWSFKIISLFFILTIIINLVAQDNSLLDDNDILWIAESEIEYVFEDAESNYLDYEMLSIEGNVQYASSYLYKMDVLFDELPFPNNQFNHWIRDMIEEEYFSITSVKEGKLLTMEEVEYILMGIKIDTLEDRQLPIPISSHSKVEFYSYIVKQKWYFDKEKNRLFTDVIAITPCEYVYPNSTAPLFTLEVKNAREIDEKDHLKSQHVKWVLSNEMKIDFYQEFQSLKGNTETFFNDYLMNTKHHCEEYESYFSNTKCNELEFYKKYRNHDSELDEERIKAKKVIYFNDVKGIEIQQLFYIDFNSNEFGSIINQVSPLVRYEFKDDYPPLYQKVWTVNNY